LRSIQAGNGLISLFAIRHFYETKATRTPGLTVRQNAHAIHLPKRLEQLAQLVFRSVEAEIANKDVLHWPLLSVCEPGTNYQQTESCFTEVRKGAASIANIEENGSFC
jgi:hypothetical protein